MPKQWSPAYFLGAFPVFRFFFFLVVVPTDFHSVCRDLVLCGFQKVHTFPADLGLSAFQVRADFAQISNFLRFGFVSATNAPRLLPFRSLIVLSIFCSTGFSCRFPRFHLCLFGLVQWLLRVSKHLFIFSVLSFCASSLDFEQACLFPGAGIFVVSVCLLSISTIVWVSIAIFYFPHRLAQFFVCLSVLVVLVQDFEKTWPVCRSNSVPSTDLLSGFEIVEIFCQVLEGPPECRKKLMVNTMWRLSLSRVQHVEAALAC